MSGMMMHVLMHYLMIGAVAGFLSGLLGIGGGLFVVPALAFTFREIGFPNNIIMHLAVGSSFMIMVITASRAVLAHLRYALPFWYIFQQLLPGVIVGTLGGAIIAHWLHSSTLSVIFSAFVMIVAIEIFFFPHVRLAKQLPAPPLVAAVGGFIGLKSGLLGVGGGAITVPFLTICDVSMRQAVVVSAAVSLTVAVVGTLAFGIIGDSASHQIDWTFGYIYFPAVFGVSIGSVIFAPIGTKVSHWMPVPVLKKIFGIFLVMVSVHMFLNR